MESWSDSRRQLAVEHLESAGWLQHVEWLTEVDSTNSLARRRLDEQLLPRPALLIADQQLAGRGRANRQWWSPSGCLMFSLVVDTRHVPDQSHAWSQLSLVAGVAAAAAVEHEVPSVQVDLKWPNDLYVRNRKLAGILVEAVPLSGAEASDFAFVIGMGLNVAVDFRDAPEEVAHRACSLSQFSTTPLSLESILIRIIEQIAPELDQWRELSPGWWQRWSQRSLLTGRTIQVQLPDGRRQSGRCAGIDARGHLLLDDTQGRHGLQSADILHWE